MLITWILWDRYYLCFFFCCWWKTDDFRRAVWITSGVGYWLRQWTVSQVTWMRWIVSRVTWVQLLQRITWVAGHQKQHPAKIAPLLKKQSNFAVNCIEAVTQGSTQKIDNLMSSFVCWKTRWSCTISWRKTMFHSTALSFLLLCSVQTSHGLLSSTSVLLVTFCFTVVM